ncbi:MAG: OmpA family protein [Deltaproteobacteria bacterium]|nr:OmpA family protein [Deltaproteobacteria bacterium]
MKNVLMGKGIVLLLLLLLASCATGPQPMAPFSPQSLDGKVSSGDYVAKPENFVVVFDGSSSMAEPYKGSLNTGNSKFAVAKDLVDRMNKTMPALPIQGGMTAFGLGKAPVTTVYGMTDYTQDGLAQSLGRVSSPAGTTPMGLGLAEAGTLLKDASGDIAIIVFGDGEENTTTTAALDAANALKEQFGDRACLYTVFVGNTDKGRKLMSDIAATSACGMATSADELASADAMAAFVEKVFLEKAPAKPFAKPAPLPVPQPKISWILSGVNFDLNKAVVRQDAKDILQNDIKILKENPQIRVEVQGHTCDLGDAAYNRSLSDKRANAIKDYLVSQGVAADRLTARGYGEDRPRFPNDSEANRAKNRRVELVPMN